MIKAHDSIEVSNNEFDIDAIKRKHRIPANAECEIIVPNSGK